MLALYVFQQQQDPPDLEEMFRRFVRQLKGGGPSSMDAFRNRGSSGGGGGPAFGKLPMALLAALVSSVILLGAFISGFYTVDQSERAVTFRFGKPVGVSQPGLRWVIPFVEDYRIVNLTGVRTVEIGYRGSQKNKVARESLMLTDNLNIIDLQFAVQYLLNDPENFLYNNRNPEEAVLQVAETAMREIVGRSNIDFVLYEGREQIAQDAQVLMQDILDRYQTGILVQQVAIQNVQPPDQVQDAFEDAIRARQDRERKINEGQAYANEVVPRARGSSSRILEDAEAYKRRRIEIAKGASQRFSQLAAEYDNAPVVTRQRLYLDTLEDVLGKTGKIIIDQEEGASNLLYLPLDRLLAKHAQLPIDYGSGADATVSSSDGLGSSSSGQLNLEQIRNEVRRRLDTYSQ